MHLYLWRQFVIPFRLKRKFILITLLGILILPFFSHRVRKNIAFTFQQLRIDWNLNTVDQVKTEPIHSNSPDIPHLEILKELSRRNELNSQRLIYLFHQHLNANYKFFDLTKGVKTSSLPHIGNSLNLRVLSKTNNYFEGLGGICIMPSIYIDFDNSMDLEEFLKGLSEGLTIRQFIEVNSISYRVDIQPFFFTDWSWRKGGVNWKIISSYEDFDPKHPHEIILKSRINGVFGPEIDYYPGIETDFSKIFDFTSLLIERNKLAFAKHFGYRRNYRTSKKNENPDPHFNVTIVNTPYTNFMTQDIMVYDKLIASLDNDHLGTMIGHHILNPIDSTQPAVLSQKVMDLKSNYTSSVSISDAMGMDGIEKFKTFEYLMANSKTDLILASDLSVSKMEVLKSLITNGDFSLKNSLEKILQLKYDLDLIKINRMDDCN